MVVRLLQVPESVTRKKDLSSLHFDLPGGSLFPELAVRDKDGYYYSEMRLSVFFTDLALAAIVVTAWQTIGIKEYLLIQMPTALIAGTLGVWIFYIQHNFPGTYFSRQKEWNHLTASMRGASYYKLPPILQWATGNIGFHHVHHVRPRIPNYNLPKCYAETRELHVKGLTLRRSLDALFLSLWDEDKKKLVGFRDIKKLKRKRAV